MSAPTEKTPLERLFTDYPTPWNSHDESNTNRFRLCDDKGRYIGVITFAESVHPDERIKGLIDAINSASRPPTGWPGGGLDIGWLTNLRMIVNDEMAMGLPIGRSPETVGEQMTTFKATEISSGKVFECCNTSVPGEMRASCGPIAIFMPDAEFAARFKVIEEDAGTRLAEKLISSVRGECGMGSWRIIRLKEGDAALVTEVRKFIAAAVNALLAEERGKAPKVSESAASSLPNALVLDPIWKTKCGFCGERK